MGREEYVRQRSSVRKNKERSRLSKITKIIQNIRDSRLGEMNIYITMALIFKNKKWVKEEENRRGRGRRRERERERNEGARMAWKATQKILCFLRIPPYYLHDQHR